MGLVKLGPNHSLNGALYNFRNKPAQTVAVLVTETGALKCLEHPGDPNFLDDIATLTQEGIRRTLTYRYVRTDIVTVTGHRVYVLHEVDSGDLSSQPCRSRAAGPQPRRERLRDELAGSTDEGRDDEP